MDWRSGAVKLLLIASFSILPGTALAVEFRKVVDTQTPMPGTAGSFESLSLPALDAGRVAFGGWSPAAEGVFLETGSGLQVVADLTTGAPGTTSTFSAFHDVSHADGTVAFHAMTWEAPESQEGIFVSAGGVLGVVVDEATHFPGHPSPSETYYDFHSPVTDAGAVYFYGRRATDEGIHRSRDGTIAIVFAADVQMPGGVSNLSSFRFAVGGGAIAFAGNGMWDEEGVYRVLPGSLQVVADWMTPVPDQADVFTDFSWGAAVDSDRVVFTGGGSSSHGIYAHEGNSLSTLVDLDTPAPGPQNETFEGFGFVSVDGDETAFEAWASDGTQVRQALYVERDGVRRRVIGASDLLDGKVVTSFLLGPEALDGNELAFIANFEGLDQGIYVATLPPVSAPVPSLPPMPLVGLAGAILALGYGALQRSADSIARSTRAAPIQDPMPRAR
jgi:hypothetical protein